MGDARGAALAALIAWRRKGQWPERFFRRETKLSPLDTALASAITMGTLQNLRLIDYALQTYCSMPLHKLDPQVLDILRIGVYQLAFLDRVPKSAAVNESVRLAKAKSNPRAAGLVNAVLRRAASEEHLPRPDKRDMTAYLGITYSHPDWFVARMRDMLGDGETEKLLEANNAPVLFAARVNTLKTDAQALLERLRGEGIEAEACPIAPDALYLPQLKKALSSDAFSNGLFSVQDAASQMAVHALSPRPGGFLIDMCAAPGGKTLLASQLMEGRGVLLAGDVSEEKVNGLRETLNKYGAGFAQAERMDGTEVREDLINKAQYVICDVPCSGTGVIRKKPDIRFKTWDDIKDLPRLQRAILQTAAAYLAPGGRLLYSTCSVLPEENSRVIDGFLKENPAFSLLPVSLPGISQGGNGQVSLLPHRDGTDGFYFALLTKENASC